MRTTLWSTSAGDIPANLAFTNNFNATTNPGVTNDSRQKYQIGSVWVNRTTKIPYICTDATAGAAVWAVTSAGNTTPAQITAPAATTPTGTGGAASFTGGTGGTTSGPGGASSQTGGAAVAGNSAGGAASQTGGAGSGNAAGGATTQTGGVGGATGAGGTSAVTGGAGGATSGNGGNATVAGGAAAAGNSNGGSAIIQGGAGNGSGVAGSVRELGVVLRAQGAPGALDATGTLTAAQMLTGIITSSTAAAVNATLPLATAMDTAIPDSAANDSFDFSVINTGPNSFTILTAAGWAAFVGSVVVATATSARFRARKTGTGAWTLYRV